MSDAKEVALAPCPFCGGNPNWCGDGKDWLHTCHQISCKCGVQFDVTTEEAHNAETIELCRIETAKIWNTRANEIEGKQSNKELNETTAESLAAIQADAIYKAVMHCAEIVSSEDESAIVEAKCLFEYSDNIREGKQ